MARLGKLMAGPLPDQIVASGRDLVSSWIISVEKSVSHLRLCPLGSRTRNVFSIGIISLESEANCFRITPLNRMRALPRDFLCQNASYGIVSALGRLDNASKRWWIQKFVAGKGRFMAWTKKAGIMPCGSRSPSCLYNVPNETFRHALGAAALSLNPPVMQAASQFSEIARPSMALTKCVDRQGRRQARRFIQPASSRFGRGVATTRAEAA